MSRFKDVAGLWIGKKVDSNGKPRLTGRFNRDAAGILAQEIDAGRLDSVGILISHNDRKQGNQPDYRLALILPDDEERPKAEVKAETRVETDGVPF